ncbi:hypothetical protein [Haloimpatiens lingqiaonensis]|nr:hypothetical protein [Haloimpatiens lingqiaonensis]
MKNLKFDDVISTGELLITMERLVEKSGGIINAKAAIIIFLT